MKVTNYRIGIEKEEAGTYYLVEKWSDKVYGEMENTLSQIYKINTHKWRYTYFGEIYYAKSLREVIEILNRIYNFKEV